MNTLIGVRTNVIYAKKKDKDGNDRYDRHQELIFLVNQPAYNVSNEGDIIRQRQVIEQRFVVSDKAFGEMMELLAELRKAEPEELH